MENVNEVNEIVEAGNEAIEAVGRNGNGVGKKVGIAAGVLALAAGVTFVAVKVGKKIKAKKEAKRIDAAKVVVVDGEEEKTEEE